MEANRKKKISPKQLIIKLWDGTTIQEKNATETFIEVIRKLNPQEVSKLTNIQVEGFPLVVSEKDDRLQLKKVDEQWYASTHMSTDVKKRILYKIAELLNKEIEIIVL